VAQYIFERELELALELEQELEQLVVEDPALDLGLRFPRASFRPSIYSHTVDLCPRPSHKACKMSSHSYTYCQLASVLGERVI